MELILTPFAWILLLALIAFGIVFVGVLLGAGFLAGAMGCAWAASWVIDRWMR